MLWAALGSKLIDKITAYRSVCVFEVFRFPQIVSVVLKYCFDWSVICWAIVAIATYFVAWLKMVKRSGRQCYPTIRIRRTAPLIINLGTRWRWVVSLTTRSLYLRRKSSRYPLSRWLGGSQRRSGRFEENSLIPARILTQLPLARSRISNELERTRKGPFVA